MKYSEQNERYKAAGIYKLVFGDEFYIGSSMNMQKRANQHYYAMRSGKSSLLLNDAWNRYKAFDLEVIEYIDPEKPKWYLKSREVFWIAQLNPPLNAGGVTGAHSEAQAKYDKGSCLPIKTHRKNRQHTYSDQENKLSRFLYFYYPQDDIDFVLIATSVGGKIWFAACDVVWMLGYYETTRPLKKYVDTDNIYPDLLRTDKGELARFINSDGVISLLGRAKKPNAHNIKDWFEHEVLPKLKETE